MSLSARGFCAFALSALFCVTAHSQNVASISQYRASVVIVRDARDGTRGPA